MHGGGERGENARRRGEGAWSKKNRKAGRIEKVEEGEEEEKQKRGGRKKRGRGGEEKIIHGSILWHPNLMVLLTAN